ncbi:MAG TPA: hypothetical protein VIY29_08655 [Ktedonobacteraceae bacterium]
MNLPSTSNPSPERARPWLEKHYEATRQRTVGLVKAAVDRLIQHGKTVTIEAICQQSQQLNPQGKGIKKAGILGNAQAYAYYRQHCASLGRTLRRTSRQPATTAYRLPTDPHRDLKQVRRRYLRESKTALVERLLFVEQAYLESQQQLARLQFELLDQQQKAQKRHENPSF